MLLNHPLRTRFVEAQDESTDVRQVDTAIEALMDAGWHVHDDLDVIEHGMKKLVLRILNMKPLFDAAGRGQLDKPVVQVVGELIEQLRHNVPGGASELDRMLAAVPPGQAAAIEFWLQKVRMISRERVSSGWSITLL